MPLIAIAIAIESFFFLSSVEHLVRDQPKVVASDLDQGNEGSLLPTEQLSQVP